MIDPTAPPNPLNLPAIFAVSRHAWRQLVYATSTYVFQAALLIALAVCVFIVGGLYESDYASLDLMWTFLPGVALFLVPAFAMRAFSTQGGDRELELIATMPLSNAEVVAGKWLAGSALLLITLAATLPIALTAAYLGTPDPGPMASGYCGAALLLVTFYALALLAAALTREQTSAYVLAAALLSVLTLLGSDTAARFLPLPPAIFDALGQLNPKLNLDRLATGRIELSAVLNFAVLIGLALWGTTEALAARRAPQSSPARVAAYTGGALLAVFASLALMAVVSKSDLSADFTSQRQYTLNSATIDAARALPPGTSIDLYWSENEPSVPARIRAHAHRTGQWIAALAGRSNGRLTYTLHATSLDTEAEWEARAHGIRRVPMSSGDQFMLGLVIRQAGRQTTIDYLDVDRASAFEYDLALALTKLGQAHAPKIALISPLLTPSNLTQPREGLSFIQDLKRTADLAIVPFFADSLPAGLDVVVVIGGALLKPSMLYALDQHVMAGKGLIVCLDPHTRFNLASDATAPIVTGGLENLADLLDRYGIKYEARVTGDANLAAPILGEDQQKTTYPFWLRVPRAQISAAHPATANLTELLFPEPGSLVLSPSSTAVSLVATTSRSGTLPAADFTGSSPASLAAKFAPDGKVRTLAAFAPGPLISAFPLQPSPTPSHLKQSAGPTNVFAVADVDWLFDPAAIDGAGTPASRPLNDNHAFLANMIDVASHDVRLLDMRSRGTANRRFTRIDQLLANARSRLQADENDATAKIAKVDGTIIEIVKAAQVQNVAELPLDIRAQIDKLNLALLPIRRRLRDIRRQTREEIEALGRSLTLANLAAGPLLTLMFAGYVASARRYRGSNRAAP